MSTKTLGGTQNLGDGDPIQSIVNSLGTDIFKQGTVLRIEIEGAEPVLIKPKQETVFGRRDPATGTMPDVDLTPFAGYRMGVSRKHAVIRQDESGERLDLYDLGSSNGTFLNGTRLSANKPHKLRDGDEVRFGQMIMRLHFQKAVEEAPASQPAATSTPAASTNPTPAQPASTAAPGATPTADKPGNAQAPAATSALPGTTSTSADSNPSPAQPNPTNSNAAPTTNQPTSVPPATTTANPAPASPSTSSTPDAAPANNPASSSTTDPANTSATGNANPTPKS